MAGVSLIFGFALSTAAFYAPPVGEVHPSVLYILGQCFIFAAAILGISLHSKTSVRQMAADLNSKIERRFAELEDEVSEAKK